MKHCIACGKLLPEASLFELTSAPASAQDIPDAASVQQDKGVTLQLRQCSGCGLVQFDCDPVPYYRDVIRAGGGSSTMRELRTAQYRHLIETYHLEGKTFFEAGCGRGEFLKFLQEFPVEIYGMEIWWRLRRRRDFMSGENFRSGRTSISVIPRRPPCCRRAAGVCRRSPLMYFYPLTF
mgnify:CR=1 FL=1